MAEAIISRRGGVSGGIKWASGWGTTDSSGIILVDGLDFDPSVIIIDGLFGYEFYRAVRFPFSDLYQLDQLYYTSNSQVNWLASPFDSGQGFFTLVADYYSEFAYNQFAWAAYERG